MNLKASSARVIEEMKYIPHYERRVYGTKGLGIPCADYYKYLVQCMKDDPSEHLKEKLRKHKTFCETETFKVGDIWQSPSYAQWEVVDVSDDGTALFVHIKKPERTCKLRWDSDSARSWTRRAKLLRSSLKDIQEQLDIKRNQLLSEFLRRRGLA